MDIETLERANKLRQEIGEAESEVSRLERALEYTTESRKEEVKSFSIQIKRTHVEPLEIRVDVATAIEGIQKALIDAKEKLMILKKRLSDM